MKVDNQILQSWKELRYHGDNVKIFNNESALLNGKTKRTVQEQIGILFRTSEAPDDIVAAVKSFYDKRIALQKEVSAQ